MYRLSPGVSDNSDVMETLLLYFYSLVEYGSLLEAAHDD